MGVNEYEYKVQFRRSGSKDWNDLRRPVFTDIIDARATKRYYEGVYGKYKNVEYRIVRRPKNWEPCG